MQLLNCPRSYRLRSASTQCGRRHSAEQVRAIAGLISDLEAARGLEPGSIGIIAMLETAGAVTKAAEIAAASPRLTGLTLGVEDFATSMGVAATWEVLRSAVEQVIQAARSANLSPYAVPASMADFRDLVGLRAGATFARAMGSVGGYAVHPGQVTVLNEVFGISQQELDWAQRVVGAAARAEHEGLGVFKVDGRMVDLPIITRAKQILSRSAALRP